VATPGRPRRTHEKSAAPDRQYFTQVFDKPSRLYSKRGPFSANLHFAWVTANRNIREVKRVLHAHHYRSRTLGNALQRCVEQQDDEDSDDRPDGLPKIDRIGLAAARQKRIGS